MVFSLVYVSTASDDLTPLDLRRLLKQSRADNAANAVTGLLLHRGGGFLQFIEGEQERVESLYRSIQRDERHHDVTTVRRREQPGRQFPEWTMAFGDYDPSSADPVSVENAPPDGPRTQSAAEAAFVLDLLDLFDP